MGKFFSGWATWEKLVFLLGCAIVATLLLGCGKLAYTHRKLRKYSAAADEEKKMQVVARQMSQRRKPDGSHGVDVPFGIRAIESGIEVEGVWISRSNTPELPASRGTTTLSVCDHVPRKDDSLELEKQQQPTVNRDRSASNCTAESPRVPISHDRQASEASHSGSCASLDTSDIAAVTRPNAAKTKEYPAPSSSNYSDNPAPRHSVLSPMEGLDAIHKASGAFPMSRDAGAGNSFESAPSTDDSNDSEPIAAAAPTLLSHAIKQCQHSTDLDLMHNHRMSQAAETGQLTPRIRKPGLSGEWASIANTPNANAADNGNYLGRTRTRSQSPDKNHSATSSTSSSHTFTAPPRINTLPPTVRRASLPGPNVTPFTEFCQTAPASPMLDSYRPASAGSVMSTISAMQIASDSLSGSMSAPSSPTTPAVQPPTSSPTTEPSQQPSRGSFEKRASAVVRGHGTGFEILRPGTFGPPAGPTEHVSEKLHKPQPQAPPISLHNSTRTTSTSRPRSSSGDSHRKLQKKRRPSSESDTSSHRRSGSRGSMG